MDRWWSDGTERGPVLWKGIAAILATGSLLGVAQNAIVRQGSPKDGLAWRYEVPTLEPLDAATPVSSAAATPAPSPSPSSASAPLPPDMNDPLGLGAASAGNFDVPDVARPLQIQISRVKQFFDAGAAVFVDARDTAEYVDGHIPGAINLPYDDVVTDPERLEKFDPKGKPIIVYCGGGTCELSMNLGFALVNAGKKKVLVFMGGWPEWSTTSGFPVAKGKEPQGS